jgi:Phosphotransferase enzyme family
MRAAHGWLPAVVPAEARRFRVADAELGEALVDAGAELAEAQPEVEIAASGADLRGDAELAIVTVVGPESRAGPTLVRVARRATHSLRARLRAARARRALRGKGYVHVDVIRWDLPARVRLPGLTSDGPRLPRYALAVGRKGERRPTAVESALAAAAGDRKPSWASTRAGLVVLAVDGSLLRVAIGPTRAEIDNGAAALEALSALSPPPEVEERVPWPEARGRVGLADWSLERLLSGAQAPAAVPEPLYGDCLAFLEALAGFGGRASAAHAPTTLAKTVGEVCREESAGWLNALAERLERRLEGVPRCFAHGDFFAGNLLADESGRLSGVVDWDAAGPGRLPLLDLLHLKLTRAGPFADDDWAHVLGERLLPLARDGGDEDIRRYCATAELEAEPKLLEAFVYAYWLDYAAYQLRAHPVRRMQPNWIERNVEAVLLRSAADESAR